MCAPCAVLGLVKRGVTDTPRREGSGEARGRHEPPPCPRYFIHYTVRQLVWPRVRRIDVAEPAYGDIYMRQCVCTIIYGSAHTRVRGGPHVGTALGIARDTLLGPLVTGVKPDLTRSAKVL